MATPLSSLAKTETTKTNQKPQLVLEIEGVETRYGLGGIKKYIRIGDPFLEIGNDWVIGGMSDQDNQLDVIDLNGTTTSISQQLMQDKGGVYSVSGISVSLLDTEGEITRLVTPGEIVPDILGLKANVFLGYLGTAFPQDFTQIFAGIVDEVVLGPTVVLNIAHPEQKKRGQILPKITTKLTGDVNFRSKDIQGIIYRTRRDVVGSVSIEYVGGASARGLELVTVAGNAITVEICTTVPRTQNSDVRNVIEKSLAALSLVTTEIKKDQSATLVSVQAPTTLGSDTTLNVVETKGLLLPVPLEGFRTYVRIGDEVIEYTGMTDTSLTGCTREAFADVDERAWGDYHKAGDSVESFYRLQGPAIDLALKLMMSGGPEFFAENVQIQSINEVEGLGSVENSIYFEGVNVENKFGLVSGDRVVISSATNGSNNVDAFVAEVVATPFGSYVILDGVSLVTESTTSAKAKFASKWNVFPEGAGLELGGQEVDVPEFERIKNVFASSIFEYDFYISDTVTAKDFLDQEVLFPTGCFSIPRKGKISVGFTSPPVGVEDLKEFTSENTVKPGQNKISRGIARYFYNNIAFKYNEDLLDSGKFLSGNLDLDATSKGRIKVGNKTFVIEARGLRPSDSTDLIVAQLTQRFLDRFKFAAERAKIQCFYGDSYNADVGDIVSFGDPELKLPDTKQGTRRFKPRLFEVVNKTLDIRSGITTLDLVDTAYSLEGARYGVVSPASQLDSGATTTELPLKNSYGWDAPKKERSKWTSFVGQKVLIHWGDTSENEWDHSFERTFTGFKVTDQNAIVVSPALPTAPPENAVVQVVDYPASAEPNDSEIYKRLFVFTNPSVQVLTGVSGTEFTVAPGDAAKFQVGQPVRFHKDDALGLWTDVTAEALIESVTGSNIVISIDLGLTLDNTWTAELIGFSDGGYPYRYL